METQSKRVVTAIIYLIGTDEDYFQYYSEEKDLLYKLSNDKSASIIRYANRIRSNLMLKFTETEKELVNNLINLKSMDLYKSDLEQLSKLGIEIVKSNYRTNQYIADINFLISNNIEKVKGFFPEWIKWEYIKELFVMAQGQNNNTIKNQSCKFQLYKARYPFTKYINWVPVLAGNILYNDRKFINIIYKQHNDIFTNESYLKKISKEMEQNIYDFIINSETKVEIVVDCENANVFKVISFLQTLDEEERAKIHRIALYNDINTINAWETLNEVIKDVPVENILVERISKNKSLVDVRMTAEIVATHYKDKINAYILISSDSDFWGVMSALQDTSFFVMIEKSKFSDKTKANLEENGVLYCDIDDFGTGNLKFFKNLLIHNEIEKKLKSMEFNLNEYIDQILKDLYIEADDEEKDRYFQRFRKMIKLHIDNKGDIKFIIDN